MMNSYQDIDNQNFENSKNECRNRTIGTITLTLIGCILLAVPYHFISNSNTNIHNNVKKQPNNNQFPFFNESQCMNQFTRNYTECESLCLSTSLHECIQFDPISLTCICCDFNCQPDDKKSKKSKKSKKNIKKQPNPEIFPFYNEEECIIEFQRNETECESACSDFAENGCGQFDPFSLTCVCCNSGCEPFTTEAPSNTTQNPNKMQKKPSAEKFPFYDEEECIIEFQRNETDCESACSDFAENGCGQFDPFDLICVCCTSGCEPFTTEAPSNTTQQSIPRNDEAEIDAEDFPFDNNTDCTFHEARNETECESSCVSSGDNACHQFNPISLACICCESGCEPFTTEAPPNRDCSFQEARNETECESTCVSSGENTCHEFDPITLACVCCESGCDPFTTEAPSNTTEETTNAPGTCGTCVTQPNERFYYQCARRCEIHYGTKPECINYDSFTQSCECC